MKQLQQKVEISALIEQLGKATTQLKQYERIIKILAVAVLCIAPFGLQRYLLSLLMLGLIFAIFAISVDLLWGYGGILTFGHAAFFGLGAYTMAKILEGVGLSGAGYLGLLSGILLPGLVGLIIGGTMFYRDITGGYFTIITLIISIVAGQVAISLEGITGGYNGIAGISSPEFGIPSVVMITMSGLPLYYWILASFLFTYLLAHRVIRSRFGTTIIGISDNEVKSRSLGYNTAKYKTVLFGLSSGIAGFAGALYTSYSGFVGPDSVGFLLSTEVLIWVLVGGRGTILGPAIGAIVLKFFENIISGVFLHTWTLLLGLLLIIIVLLFPSGIVGVVNRLVETDQTDGSENEV